MPAPRGSSHEQRSTGLVSSMRVPHPVLQLSASFVSLSQLFVKNIVIFLFRSGAGLGLLLLLAVLDLQEQRVLRSGCRRHAQLQVSPTCRQNACRVSRRPTGYQSKYLRVHLPGSTEPSQLGRKNFHGNRKTEQKYELVRSGVN